MELAYDYGVLVKPKVLLAMLALYLTTYFTSVAYLGELPFNIKQFTMGFFAVALSVSGANALNCILDRDIDAAMYRTNGRPMARGTIGISSALAFSWFLIGSSFVLATYLGIIPLFFLIEGAGSYILLYTIILKRRTSMNVFFTAPSVAAPAWFGWYLGGAPLYPVGLAMGLIVAIWGPLHLWSIAFAYTKDYKRVDVPMFPSLVSEKKAIRGLITVLCLLICSSSILSIWANSVIYLIGVTVLNTILVVVGLKLYHSRTKKASWELFKYTSPYIMLVFSLFMFSFII